jgi:hypothetical protein
MTETPPEPDETTTEEDHPASDGPATDAGSDLDGGEEETPPPPA